MTLNLAWLGISAVLLLVCGRRQRLSHAARNRFLVFLVLLCVIALLFPVISMTDDLNSSPAIPEASKLKKVLLPVHMVVALLDQLIFQVPHERTWAVLALQPDLRPPSRELLTFNLSRRPPPYLLA